MLRAPQRTRHPAGRSLQIVAPPERGAVKPARLSPHLDEIATKATQERMQSSCSTKHAYRSRLTGTTFTIATTGSVGSGKNRQALVDELSCLLRKLLQIFFGGFYRFALLHDRRPCAAN